jgi:hypothetical protein
MYDPYAEAMQSLHSEEREMDREKEQERRENFRTEDETTYERAEREAMMEDEVQADYEREDKMGAI